MAQTITLSDDYGLQQTRLRLEGSTTIDASEARWIVANIGSETNRYPVFTEGGTDVTLIGGTIDGLIPLDMDWREAYVNSAAIFARGFDSIRIRDWSIDRAWDGIRVHGDRSDTFEISNVYMSRIRDDAVENDMGLSGTIKDSFFDGVFVGLSTTDENTGNMNGNTITLDNVLMRIEPYLYRGVSTHGSPFKVWTHSPKMDINDSVIAIQNPNHFDQERLRIAWDLVENSSNNFYLNLSDTPFPKNYPLPQKGFTVLQGQEARDYWATASAEWGSDDVQNDDDVNSVPGDADSGSNFNSDSDGRNGPENASSNSESRNEELEEGNADRADDAGPGGIFGLIVRLIRAIFGGGRGSDDSDQDVGLPEVGWMSARSVITDEDIGRIMLPPLVDTPPSDDYDESESDKYAFI